jgi:hypothetical protein
MSYATDIVGDNPDNLVQASVSILQGNRDIIVPEHAPFFVTSLVVYDPETDTYLKPVEDFTVIHFSDTWMSRTQQPIACFIYIHDRQWGDKVNIRYVTVGDEGKKDVPELSKTLEYVNNLENDLKWGQRVEVDTVDGKVPDFGLSAEKATYDVMVNKVNDVADTLFHGDIDHHEEMEKYAIGTRERNLATVVTEFKLARQHLLTHIENPRAHNLTKKQIGLEYYPNFPLATTSVIKDGGSNRYLFTPKRLRQMLDTWAVDPLKDHIENESPAHGLTAFQVGLGLMENYPFAPIVEAEQGRKETYYMNPIGLNYARVYQFDTKFSQHRYNKSAHSLNKDQLGLPLINNWPILDLQGADKDEVAPQLLNERYMTPLGMYDLIKHLHWDDQLSHVYDTNDPHDLTAEQVDLGKVDNVSLDEMREMWSLKSHKHYDYTKLPFRQQDVYLWRGVSAFVLGSGVLANAPEPDEDGVVPLPEPREINISVNSVPDDAQYWEQVMDPNADGFRQMSMTIQGQLGIQVRSIDVSDNLIFTMSDTWTELHAQRKYLRKFRLDWQLVLAELENLMPSATYTNRSIKFKFHYYKGRYPGLQYPDWAFFHPRGVYPFLRARATTKEDIGLSKYRNMSVSEYDSELALENHVHQGVNWAPVTWLNEEFMTQAFVDGILDEIEFKVRRKVLDDDNVTKKMMKISGQTITRAPWFGTHEMYGGIWYRLQLTGIRWYCRHLDAVYVTHPSFTKGASAVYANSYTFPQILPNTGRWYIYSSYNATIVGGTGIDNQPSTLIVDTGEPKNPFKMVREAYAALGRSNIYLSTMDADGETTLNDIDGPTYWMNNKKYGSDFALRKDMATAGSRSTAPGGPRDNARNWLRSKISPSELWGTWVMTTTQGTLSKCTAAVNQAKAERDNENGPLYRAVDFNIGSISQVQVTEYDWSEWVDDSKGFDNEAGAQARVNQINTGAADIDNVARLRNAQAVKVNDNLWAVNFQVSYWAQQTKTEYKVVINRRTFKSAFLP